MAFVKKINISSEAKSMGIDFYVPFLIILIAILYTCFSPDLESLQYISRIIEFVVCPIAAWWSVYLFSDQSVDKDKTAELTPNSSPSILSYGLIRVTSFFLIFLATFFVLLISITLRYPYPYISLFNLTIIYVPQTVLYCYLGFFLMVLSRNIAIPLFILLTYIAIKYWTTRDIPIYNVMSFSIDMQLYPRIILLAVKNIVLALALAVAGHFVLVRRKKI
ncbi:hypothetical protein CCZ20_08460 [Priestia aryabhattai]|nr:hypothetical protein [Priestia aryabhattai]MBZ6487728.1 hypothetical protein [Priestia aryabhattai]OHY76326.1 hypothetical protein BCV52_16600 [Priestia aryabhattai]OVE37859.1 hypothetical protein CCZ20_08460 [Priestia aryabhattai]